MSQTDNQRGLVRNDSADTRSGVRLWLRLTAIRASIMAWVPWQQACSLYLMSSKRKVPGGGALQTPASDGSSEWVGTKP